MTDYAPPVRWREDVGWEMRCLECARKGKASFWPLTFEFWAPKQGMTRCRGCQKEHRRDLERIRYAGDRAYRELRKWQAARYRSETREYLNAKRRYYYWRNKAAARAAA